MTVDRFEGSTPRPWERADFGQIVGPHGSLIAQFRCHENRDLTVRAVNLMDAWQAVAEAAGSVKQGVCGCVYAEEWIEDPGDEIFGGYSIRGELRQRCNQCITHEALAAALARLAEAEKAQT